MGGGGFVGEVRGFCSGLFNEVLGREGMVVVGFGRKD